MDFFYEFSEFLLSALYPSSTKQFDGSKLLSVKFLVTSKTVVCLMNTVLIDLKYLL